VNSWLTKIKNKKIKIRNKEVAAPQFPEGEVFILEIKKLRGSLCLTAFVEKTNS
jgi:hypothetical protein